MLQIKKEGSDLNSRHQNYAEREERETGFVHFGLGHRENLYLLWEDNHGITEGHIVRRTPLCLKPWQV